MSNPFNYEIDITTNPNCELTETYLIDSRDRNEAKESAGQYTIKLNKSARNVSCIELIGCKFPNLTYNVTQNNNLLAIQETAEHLRHSTYTSVKVPPGHYDACDLESALDKAINLVTINTYQVKLDKIARKFTIRAIVEEDDGLVDNKKKHVWTGIFNLIFTTQTEFDNDSGFMDRTIRGEDCFGQPANFQVRTQRYGCQKNIYLKNSLGRMLGFLPINLFRGHCYTSQTTYNLVPIDYLALYVNDYDVVRSNNSKISDCFAILPLDYANSCFHFKQVDNCRIIKHFNPMLKEIHQFTIKIVDSDGNIYDFQGHDHSLIFRVTRGSAPPPFTRGSAPPPFTP